MADFFAFLYECFCHVYDIVIKRMGGTHLSISTQTEITSSHEEKRVYKENELDDVFKELDELKTLKMYKREKWSDRKQMKRKKTKVTNVSEIVEHPSKEPAKIKLVGAIAQMNVNTVFEKVRQNMRRYYTQFGNRYPGPAVLEKYTNFEFEKKIKNNQHDLAFVYKIQCHKAAEDILGDKSFYSKTQSILEALKDYDIQNRSLIECMVNCELFFKALSENKYGEASDLVLKTKHSLHQYENGTWTGILSELDGQLMNMLAFIWPQTREENYRNSFSSFETTRKLFIKHDKGMRGSYSWVYYLFQMQTSLLHLPLRKHLQFVVNSTRAQDIVAHSPAKMEELKMAEALIQTAQSEFPECDDKYADSFKYNLALAEINVELRRAQFLQKENRLKASLLAAEKALGKCDTFVGYVEQEENAFYLSYARRWVEDIIKEYLLNLRDRLVRDTENAPSDNSDKDFKMYMKRERIHNYKDDDRFDDPSSSDTGISIESDAVAS